MKKILMILTLTAILFTATSCKTKVDCFWCGEEKYCEKREIFDETIYICQDCLNELEEEFAGE